MRLEAYMSVCLCLCICVCVCAGVCVCVCICLCGVCFNNDVVSECTNSEVELALLSLFISIAAIQSEFLNCFNISSASGSVYLYCLIDPNCTRTEIHFIAEH